VAAPGVVPLLGGHPVAHADLAIGQDVGVEPAAVDEILDDPGPGQLLEMQARLAEFDVGTLDISDPEPPADQIIEPHSPDDHLAARLRPGQAHVLQRLSLDQRQCLARLRAIGAEVPIAPEPFTRERRDRPGRHERLAGADIDLLDIHKPIMAAATRSANRITTWCVAAPDSTEVIESPASEESGCCPVDLALARMFVDRGGLTYLSPGLGQDGDRSDDGIRAIDAGRIAPSR
jgi:hypothetical protein